MFLQGVEGRNAERKREEKGYRKGNYEKERKNVAEIKKDE